jgi:hypothetical protein
MGANVLYLKEGTRDHFMGFLAKEYPHLVEAYNRLYAGPYAPAGYISAVRGMLDALQKRYDVKRRASQVSETSDEEPQTYHEPEQNAFQWDANAMRPAARARSG